MYGKVMDGLTVGLTVGRAFTGVTTDYRCEMEVSDFYFHCFVLPVDMSGTVVDAEVSSYRQLMINAISLDDEQRGTTSLTSQTRTLVHHDLDEVEKQCKALLELVSTLINEAQKQQVIVHLADERVAQAKTSAAAALAVAANTESELRAAQEQVRDAIRVNEQLQTQVNTGVSAAQTLADAHSLCITKLKLQAQYDVERANAERDAAQKQLRAAMQELQTEKCDAATALASLRRQITSTSQCVPPTIDSAESAMESAKQVERIRRLKLKNGELEREVAAVAEELKRVKCASAPAARTLRSSTGKLAVVTRRDTDSAQLHKRAVSKRTRRRITEDDEHDGDDVETAIPALTVAHCSDIDGDNESDRSNDGDSDYVQTI